MIGSEDGAFMNRIKFMGWAKRKRGKVDTNFFFNFSNLVLVLDQFLMTKKVSIYNKTKLET